MPGYINNTGLSNILVTCSSEAVSQFIFIVTKISPFGRNDKWAVAMTNEGCDTVSRSGMTKGT